MYILIILRQLGVAKVIKNKIKKSYIAIVAVLMSPGILLEQTAQASSAENLNPYHETWSCQITKDDSDKSSSPKSKWACIRKDSKKSFNILNPDIPKKSRQQLLSESLGWMPDNSDTSSTCNTCSGKYYQRKFKEKNVSISKSLSQIEYSKFQEDIKGHQLHFQGNVELAQPSRVLYTDSATIDYNPKTKKPSVITAKGDVKLIQPGEMIIAQKGTAYLSKNKGTLENAIYLFKVPSSWALKEQFKDKNFTGFAHGNASKITQKSKFEYSLDNASYTTCPPTKHTWELSAKKINLNKKTGRGTSNHTVMRVLGAPVFYFP